MTETYSVIVSDSKFDSLSVDINEKLEGRTVPEIRDGWIPLSENESAPATHYQAHVPAKSPEKLKTICTSHNAIYGKTHPTKPADFSGAKDHRKENGYSVVGGN